MADRTGFAERTMVAAAVVLIAGHLDQASRLKALGQAFDAVGALQADWVARRRCEPEPTAFAVAIALERMRQDAAAGRSMTGSTQVLRVAVHDFFAARAAASHAALQDAV